MIKTFHEEALAIPYRVEFSIPYEEMKKAFDEYWEKDADKLIAFYKPQVRKSKGGKINKEKARKILESNMPPGQLYQNALAGILETALKEKDKELFHIDALTLFDYEKDKDSVLVGRVYYWPEMTLKDGVTSDSLIFEAKEPFKPEPERVWEGKKTELWHKHKTVSKDELDSGPVQDNHDLLVDIIASCENVPYEKGTVRGTWFELRTLSPEIRDAIKTHNVGDLFETDFTMTSMDKEKEGKKVHAHIKIFKAREIIYKEVNDELAKIEGFDSLDAMKAGFFADYFKYVEDVKRGVAFEVVIQEILKNCIVPAVPDRWVDLKVQSMINAHVAQFKGDKDKAMATVGAKDEDELRELFRGEVFREVLRGLAFGLYKKLNGLDKVEDIEVYDSMVKKIKWEEK